MKPVRWSDLKWMAKSPAHFRYYRDEPFAPNDAMRIGARAHSLLLGYRDFVKFDGIRRGKKWKAFQDETPEGVEIVNAREWEMAEKIAESLRNSRDAVQLLMNGDIEQRIEWTIADRDCHGTPDVFAPDGLTDLKITNDADPRRFPWHARRMSWHGQLAWYADALTRLGTYGPDGPPRISIVAVESKPPFPVVIYDLTPDAIEAGRMLWRSCWERLRICEENNHWPGYSEGIELIDSGDPDTIVIDGEEVTQ